MAWIKIKGMAGLVYEPDGKAGDRKKHNCPDCFMCQWCSDDRCRDCLIRKSCKKCRKSKKK